MNIIAALGFASAAALLIIGLQSFRLFVKTHLKPSLLYSLFFLAFAGSITLSTAFIFVEPTSLLLTIHKSLIAMQLVTLGWYVCYLLALSKAPNRVGLSAVTLIPLAMLVYEIRVSLSMPSVVGAGYACVVGLTALVLTLRQLKESIARALTTLRLLLISFTIGLSSWYVVLMAVSGSSVLDNVAFAYATAMITMVLALTSFLTPIRSEADVRRPIY